MDSRPRRDPRVVAALDQWEAEGRDLHKALQAYIDKLDRQTAWHDRWDPWLVRGLVGGGFLIGVGVPTALAWWLG